MVMHFGRNEAFCFITETIISPLHWFTYVARGFQCLKLNEYVFLFKITTHHTVHQIAAAATATAEDE